MVLCHGCFDILHPGHIRHLQEARKLGDKLIVSVTDDEYVRKGRPHFSTQERVEMLKALDCVDEVIISRSHNALDVINEIRPAVFVKGGDYSNVQDENLMLERAAVETAGGRIHFTPPTHWHSSDIKRAKRFDEKTREYLNRSRHFLPAIRTAMEKARNLRVLLVGEAISDEYRYVRSMGKSAKEPLVATVEESWELFQGGVWAANGHCAAISDHSSISSWFGSQGIKKTRFVNTDYSRKMFEVYSRQWIDLSTAERATWHTELSGRVENTDVVVALDFGHGLIDEQTRRILRYSKFLAVNAQSNSANYGFNPVTKYGNSMADYVCVDAPEARLAVGDQHSSIEGVSKDLMAAVKCDKVMVTHGHRGTIAARPNATRHVPVFSSDIVDTMGAGDAFLAVTAPLVAAGLELEAAAIVGNVAGAIKCGIVGHRRSIGREELVGAVEDLLK